MAYTHGEITYLLLSEFAKFLCSDLKKNIQPLKPGQYTCIRVSDFRSAAGCSHHIDKSSLTFAAWIPRQGFTEQE